MIGGNASAWALTQNTVRTAVMGLVEAVYADAKANLTLLESQFAPETASELQQAATILTMKAACCFWSKRKQDQDFCLGDNKLSPSTMVKLAASTWSTHQA